MNKKLTLSLDSNVVEFAHDFSQRTHRPISKIIENYFIELKDKNTTDLETGLPRDLEELYGIFEGIDAPDRKEMRKMFHEKYNN
ncbi:hypothetical protein AGMMS49579_25340 [Spirochaetia bacterium]|nr:hypothetical protein AGMMS49579_25340 [Spirochaetia bacterium]